MELKLQNKVKINTYTHTHAQEHAFKFRISIIIKFAMCLYQVLCFFLKFFFNQFNLEEIKMYASEGWTDQSSNTKQTLKNVFNEDMVLFLVINFCFLKIV